MNHEEKNDSRQLSERELESAAAGKGRPGYVCRKCHNTQILQVGAHWQCTVCRNEGMSEDFWTADLDEYLRTAVYTTENGAYGGW